MCKTSMEIHALLIYKDTLRPFSELGTHALLILKDTIELFSQTCLLAYCWVSYPVCYSFLTVGPKDTPMDLVLEKTYDAKAGRGMPEL